MELWKFSSGNKICPIAEPPIYSHCHIKQYPVSVFRLNIHYEKYIVTTVSVLIYVQGADCDRIGPIFARRIISGYSMENNLRSQKTKTQVIRWRIVSDYSGFYNLCTVSCRFSHPFLLAVNVVLKFDSSAMCTLF